MPGLLSAIVDAFGGKTAGSGSDEGVKVDPEQQTKFNEWLTRHLAKVQAEGGMVSNMVVQAQGGVP